MVIVNIFLMMLLCGVVYYWQSIHKSFNFRTYISILIGGALGFFIRMTGDDNSIAKTMEYYRLLSDGYVSLLEMILFPLITVAILNTFTKVEDSKFFSKVGIIIILLLLITTGIGAFLGIFVTDLFHLKMENFANLEVAQKSLDRLAQRNELIANTDLSVIGTILNFISTNPFLDMTGSNSSSTVRLVFFLLFVGFAYLGVKRKKPDMAMHFTNLIQGSHAVIMRLVILILRLTPYALLALMAKLVASVNIEQIKSLLGFTSAMYIAMAIMFVVHLGILAMFKLNPWKFLTKSMPVLSFAFTSRSSMAAIPLNVEVQNQQLGVPESLATLGSSFGALIGQNACAGIFTACLATITASSMGVDVMGINFLVSAILIIMVSSFGVAGVGGGAIFASLIVLPNLGLPTYLIPLVLAIDPIIDMGRTAINVSGAMVSSIVTSKIVGTLDEKTYAANDVNTKSNVESI